MILVDKIEIQEFRGIRNLELNFEGRNFAACGPNGTGKSGIVDAIEFALTGSISRLTGAGTGGLSVKSHGPHVDSKNHPERSSVVLHVRLPSLGGKTARIKRSVKSINQPDIQPNQIDVLRVFREMKLHPEFVLSRRELIKYILSEPGQRSKEVQSLLRLEEVEKLRTLLSKIKNSCIRDENSESQAVKRSQIDLMASLNTSSLAKDVVLKEVNKRRKILNLPNLQSFENNSILIEKSTDMERRSAVPVGKHQAKSDIAALKESIKEVNSEEFKAKHTSASTTTKVLMKSESNLESLSKITLYQLAINLFSGEECPVCDTPFASSEFINSVEEKLTELKNLSKQKDKLENLLAEIKGAIEHLGKSITAVIELATKLNIRKEESSLEKLRHDLRNCYRNLKEVLRLKDIEKSLATLLDLPSISDELDRIESSVDALPDQSQRDSARDYLTLAQERLLQISKSKNRLELSTKNTVRASRVYDVYSKITTEELEKIYNSVEKSFSDFYRKVNSDDESSFSAKLLPSIGKLGFDVDFYGRGEFPPGAYHSEGHQDGMGICLYLALMNHLLGDNFCLAVLDDVVMSVDAGHRRQFCQLLKECFPNTQFIFTTHDEIWLKHMKSAGLIKGKNSVHFRTWSVELGPTQWDNKDVWAEIDESLNENDVRAAAALLRHYLEYFSREVCGKLRADVEFKGDAQYTLGDLLPKATKQMSDLYKKAKNAANSWGNRAKVKEISALEENFQDARIHSELDNWQVNSAVHYNEWANLDKSDFLPVVDNYKTLVESFYASCCGELLYVSPSLGKKECIRCRCLETNMNLCK